MTLRLEGLQVDCVIGDRPDERDRTQRLLVDAELTVADAAADTDDIRDAADYMTLAEGIRAALAEAKCRLIERAAKVAHDVCIADPHVAAARVTVSKSGSVPGLAAAVAVYGG